MKEGELQLQPGARAGVSKITCCIGISSAY